MMLLANIGVHHEFHTMQIVSNLELAENMRMFRAAICLLHIAYLIVKAGNCLTVLSQFSILQISIFLSLLSTYCIYDVLLSCLTDTYEEWHINVFFVMFFW
jgi:hypothetical protein